MAFTLLYRAGPANMIAISARSSLVVVPKSRRERFRVLSTRALATSRDIAKTEAYRTSRRQRKKVEMLLAHLFLRLDRLDCEDHAALRMNSFSPPPPRTSESSPN